MKEHTSKGLEVGLMAAAVAAPLFYGSVHDWAAMGLCAYVFFLVFLYPAIVPAFTQLPSLTRISGLVLILFLFFQTLFFSKSVYLSTHEILKWTGFAAVFLLVQQLPFPAVRRLMLTFMIIGLLESVYAYGQLQAARPRTLWQAKKAYLEFATGTYINHNHFAGMLELCLGVQMGFFINALQQRRIKTMLALGLVVVVTFAAFLKSGSRGGLLSFSGAFLYCAFMYRQAPQKKWVFAALLILVVLCACQSQILMTRFSDRWMSDSFLGRWNLWIRSRHMLQDFPMGIGLGTFEWVYPYYQPAHSLKGWAHAHNDYLELLLSLGFLGFVLLAGVFLPLVRKSWNDLKKCGESSYSLGWGCWLGLLSFTFHGFMDFNFAIPANAFLFFVCAGVLLRICDLRRGRDDEK